MQAKTQLTDLRIRQAKPQAKPYRTSDSGGLFLETRPNGKKYWRYAYRIDNKQNLYAMGSYPAMSLQQAREEHMRARALVKLGHHPAHARARTRQQVIEASRDTFRAVGEEWFESKRSIPAEGRKKAQIGWSSSYEARMRTYLDKDIYPRLGTMSMRSIKTIDVVATVDAVVKRGAPKAADVVRQIISQVFFEAISSDRADYDPSLVMRQRGRRKRTRTVHKTPLRPEAITQLIGRLEATKQARARVIAVRLLLLLFVRTNELRCTPWTEILPALKTSLWVIPEERMKMRRTHLVPLSPQAIKLLTELHKLTGHTEYLFPHNKDPRKPMGADGVNYVLRQIGYQRKTLSGHAFRTTASTLLNEMGFHEKHIDTQLAHASNDAYNQARYLAERTQIMMAWANEIDRLARGEQLSVLTGNASGALLLAA